MEHDLWWKTTFSGKRPLVDPCMLPNPLFDIFVHNQLETHIYLLFHQFFITLFLIHLPPGGERYTLHKIEVFDINNKSRSFKPRVAPGALPQYRRGLDMVNCSLEQKRNKSVMGGQIFL